MQRWSKISKGECGISLEEYLKIYGIEFTYLLQIGCEAVWEKSIAMLVEKITYTSFYVKEPVMFVLIEESSSSRKGG